MREFLETHASEVINMLLEEWDKEEYLEFRREEIREEAREEGREQGREEGLMEEKLIIAKNLLSEGSTPEFVQRITGLSTETISQL